MSYLPQFKIGDCSVLDCGLKNTQGRKVGKNFICMEHYNAAKTKIQITKANERNKLRSLIGYQKTEVGLDSISELKIDLDRVVSRYIRLRDMEADGKITCYCCSKRVPWQKAHCMHFIDRGHMATRYLLANLRSGCYTCNVEKDGNLEVYAAKLEKEQHGIVEWLKEQSRTVTSVTQSELKELLHDFHQKLKIVELKLTTHGNRKDIDPI